MRETYWFLVSYVDILADHETTDGRYDLIEGMFPPGVETPVHRHTAYSEQLYVLEGELTVRTAERTVVLAAGETLLIPRGVAHSVSAGSEPARGLVVASPSGWAKLIRAVGIPQKANEAPPTGPPDLELMARATAEAGDEILGPPGGPF